jgi:hypothetical protein
MDPLVKMILPLSPSKVAPTPVGVSATMTRPATAAAQNLSLFIASPPNAVEVPKQAPRRYAFGPLRESPHVYLRAGEERGRL